MVYFDTSFLAPLILQELTSAKVERFVIDVPIGQLATSHWTRIEFSSLLAREVRMGGMDGRAAAEADVQFGIMMNESFVIWLPNADDFDLAKDFLGHRNSGLRAGDALHLAIARNHRAQAIYSLDKAFLKAGKALGLPVEPGIRLSGY